MNLSQSPLDLLQNFDHDPEVIIQESGQCASKRGVGWVLRWAAALGGLWFAGCVLTEFCYCLTAEYMLARAARAGALEASLPRATYGSVADAVRRRLPSGTSLLDQLRVGVMQNGTSVGGAFRATGGDQITVAVTVPVRTILPGWLTALGLPWAESQIEVCAQRQVPGRFL
jgi:hypothetical protein